jgi:hypothetical protein
MLVPHGVSQGSGVRQMIHELGLSPHDEFVLIQRGPTTGARTFARSLRRTPHVRHLRKYADSQVADDKRFFFRGPDGHSVGVANSLTAFPAAGGSAPEAVLAHHAGRGDFLRWLLDVFSDRRLGHQIRKLEGRADPRRDPRSAAQACRAGGESLRDRSVIPPGRSVGI